VPKDTDGLFDLGRIGPTGASVGEDQATPPEATPESDEIEGRPAGEVDQSVEALEVREDAVSTAPQVSLLSEVFASPRRSPRPVVVATLDDRDGSAPTSEQTDAV